MNSVKKVASPSVSFLRPIIAEVEMPSIVIADSIHIDPGIAPETLINVAPNATS